MGLWRLPKRTSWPADTSPDDIDEGNYDVSGTVIRFMPDGTVSVPLWDAGGLLPEEPTRLNQGLGLSAELVTSQRGDDWNAAGLVGERFTHEQHRRRQRRLDAEAETLVERLRAELPHGFTVTLQLRQRAGQTGSAAGGDVSSGVSVWQGGHPRRPDVSLGFVWLREETLRRHVGSTTS